ncbi:MAG: ABC transporter permease [Oscillospiraceae bacterium]|nr:ABC transporter permease [Oscillospiraceae bacterium]
MSRLQYILKRILQMIPVLLVVTILVFSIVHLIPGEPARLILGDKATPAAVAALTEKLGLNEPLPTQYFLFLKQVLTLDLGTSFKNNLPVADLLAVRFPVTLALTLLSTLISVLISLPLGYFAGTHKDRLGDQVVRTASLVAISMPSFWVGLLLMILFAIKLKWLPAGGWDNTSLWGEFKCLILPAVTQSLMTTALLVRNTRNSVVDITRMDYVDFARSKGISDGQVRSRHVMRNSMISTVTLLSMRMAGTLGGSVIIETVFSIPGIGKLASDAIFGRDYAVVQSVVLLFAVMVLVINLITDILYSLLDPRVSL